MLKDLGIKVIFLFIGALSLLISPLSFAAAEINTTNLKTVIVPHIFDSAKKNENWKVAFSTGKNAQVVFMNITPTTNPNNEIGMETHTFDQVIFVVEGQASSILDGKKSTVEAGDMIFIPQGTPHNFINLNKDKPFKIISVYSDTDIPANAIYQKKSDAKD